MDWLMDREIHFVGSGAGREGRGAGEREQEKNSGGTGWE